MTFGTKVMLHIHPIRCTPCDIGQAFHCPLLHLDYCTQCCTIQKAEFSSIFPFVDQTLRKCLQDLSKRYALISIILSSGPLFAWIWSFFEKKKLGWVFSDMAKKSRKLRVVFDANKFWKILWHVIMVGLVAQRDVRLCKVKLFLTCRHSHEKNSHQVRVS